MKWIFPLISLSDISLLVYKNTFHFGLVEEDGSKIGGSGVHFPLAPVKCSTDLRNTVNSQWYSSIYKDWRPKIVEDIEKSDGKKSV